MEESSSRIHGSETTTSKLSFIFTKDYIESLEQIGLRVVGIYLPSNAAGLSWKNAYQDPEFLWSTTKLGIKQDRYSFAHAATMFGRTHLKDPETDEYYNLNALDIDSQLVYNRFSISIEQLLSDSTSDWVTNRLRNLVKAFLSCAGVLCEDYTQNLLS